MTSLGAQAAFYYLAIASITSALLAVTARNPVHSMLWVLALFLHVAGLFLLLGAEFLAAVQVIVYAGAILIFYLFVLMVLDLPDEVARPRFSRHWPFAVLVGLSALGLAQISRIELLRPADPATAATAEVATSPAAMPGGASEIGRALFGPFALPFEIASILLLASIVGAVVLARKRGT